MMLKVLFIDSDPVEHLVTDLTLHSIECDVIRANNVDTGVRCALDLRPHIILLDMDVPGNEGGKTCLQLRLNGFKGRILLVGAAFDGDVAYAVDQYEADGFITKPIWRNALLEQIESLGFHIPSAA